jgi:predicted molibdopterin-dependent oxidoreductase YjgC
MRRSRLEKLKGLARGPAVEIVVDGRRRTAYTGESVAAALMADDDELELRTTTGGEPRGLFCGMGVCFDCLVVVDDVPSTRACVTWVRHGMIVDRQRGTGFAYTEPEAQPESH